ncbi:MAG: M15 family metallopeptidase [Alphaproteobacteria bacterium]|nr:M15 family metallopeptidase [Alphaproteobacteria bacterium]
MNAFWVLQTIAFCMAFIVGQATPAAAGSSDLPEGFVHLRTVDPTILQDMRYYGAHNFLGRPVVGYEAPECVLTTPAAEQLAEVQKNLLKRNLSLKVYDCYRPARAVADFVKWAKDLDDTKTKTEFYPTVDKDRLFELGYIAERSGHSRGSTVDLAIVRLPAAQQPAFDPSRQQACFNPLEARYRDNSLDFGTGFDCFDELSHTENRQVNATARDNRAMLVDEMKAAGFQNYDREWWHFTLADEPFPKTYFDFPIQPGAEAPAKDR